MAALIAMRAALRGGVPAFQRRTHGGQPAQGQPKSIKEYDEHKYGGWKSVELLFSEDQRKSIVGRWDWHVVQFLLALIPPGVMLLIVQWARSDMERTQALRTQQALDKESEKQTVLAKHRQGAQPASGTDAAGPDVQQRLSRLEELVVALQKQQETRLMQGAAAAPTQQPVPAAGSGSQDQQAQPGPQGGETSQQPAASQTWAGRLASGWGWASSRVSPRARQSDAAASSASHAGSSDTESPTTAAPTGASLQPVPEQQAHAAAGPAAAAAATLPAAGGRMAPAGAGRAPPGTTANLLLHMLGQPIRWLRQQAGGRDE